MRIIKGDIIKLALDGQFDVIVHGCNCFHTMGAGVAKQIKTMFPAAYKADLMTKYGDKSKLGTYSIASVDNLKILNAYTQYDFSGSGIKVHYSAIKSVFSAIKSQYSGKRIGYPKIGAGLAGGNWGIISEIIDKELEGEDHALVVYLGGV
jgi:O-acetyl-ADP-ribose deacetylase (regulator of RNase III)